jgi:pyruvate/2-oxoglutarate/acetoin dehydrogenase E1 component
VDGVVVATGSRPALGHDEDVFLLGQDVGQS